MTKMIFASDGDEWNLIVKARTVKEAKKRVAKFLMTETSAAETMEEGMEMANELDYELLDVI